MGTLCAVDAIEDASSVCSIYLVQEKLDAVIIDTSGRLQIDDKLMGELAAAKKVAFSPGLLRIPTIPPSVPMFSCRFLCCMLLSLRCTGSLLCQAMKHMRRSVDTYKHISYWSAGNQAYGYFAGRGCDDGSRGSYPCACFQRSGTYHRSFITYTSPCQSDFIG